MKKKILIKGNKVHDVGYRLLLMDLAEDIEIGNFDARNVMKGNKQIVSVLIESSENNVTEFFNQVKEKDNMPEHAEVDSMDWEDYGERVKSFERYERSFMRWQQAKIANSGVGILEVQKLILKHTSRIPKIEENTSRIPAIEENTSRILEHTSNIPKIEEHTSLIPAIEEHTSLIPAIEEHTSLIPAIEEHTSLIPAIEEHTSEMKESLSQLIPKVTVMEQEQEVMKRDIVRIKESVGIAA